MAPTERLDTAFLAMEAIAPGVASFRFEKPGHLTYSAGQYVLVSVVTRDGEQTKPFTLSSAPGDPYLEIATRLTGSAFKDALLALRPGDRVAVAGPRGRMVVPPGAGRIAFLVGGIGVTPARSIVRDAAQRATSTEFVLFYGNRDEGSVAFGAELDGYAAADARIRVVHVLEKPGPGWTGETGFITVDVVRRHIDPNDGWRLFISGPPPMIEPMRAVAVGLAVPEDRLMLESWGGAGVRGLRVARDRQPPPTISTSSMSNTSVCPASGWLKSSVTVSASTAVIRPRMKSPSGPTRSTCPSRKGSWENESAST
jgi:ferredoxin-NADP reductase